MRKTLSGLGLAICLALAPTSAAIAEAPATTPITQQQPSPPQGDRDDGGGGGLWGLAGLLGLLGLLGMRRPQHHKQTGAEYVRHDRP
ncbi:hypothetical protein Misp01_16320 [Microtetraspora sp. NBRC 13810]|uniref:WGxxGxxG family protein n=1 Tax=Microtetraspora sp. NBRC 13810 TaxID=3030990 RepID=UPI0024A11E32|nr:WGxxGxxG family protein [Microtetraspora sp. NBRC 13810]GLW06502.1 hypothetical protein Misp01_16320 [Microtetraspora sp. NBRC 13810]